MHYPAMAKSIKLLDCTLRDGGHVNNWNFSNFDATTIANGLFKANIDIVELGLLKPLAPKQDSTIRPNLENFFDLSNNISCSENYATVMIRPDWVEEQIFKPVRSTGLIKGIRVAFYPNDLNDAIRIGEKLRDSGYDVYMNLIGVSCYSMADLRSSIKEINRFSPYAVSIVDTFGSFNSEIMRSIYYTFENYLSPEVTIGLHLHENRGQALSIATDFIKISEEARNIILDASLLGMGRIPGNLCIENIAQELNLICTKDYNLESLYEIIETFILPIKKITPWGYSPAYLASAMNNINRNYAEFFLDNKVPLHLILEACRLVSKHQKSSFKFDECLAKEVIGIVQ